MPSYRRTTSSTWHRYAPAGANPPPQLAGDAGMPPRCHPIDHRRTEPGYSVLCVDVRSSSQSSTTPALLECPG